MTQAEFELYIDAQARKHGSSLAELREIGLEVAPCSPRCDYAGCHGWVLEVLLRALRRVVNVLEVP
jgi:hypothetical protein